jgi:predicted restriction endonuclease
MKVNCKKCGMFFNKLPKEIKKTINNFCSQSCAAKYNNKIYPKRRPVNGYSLNCSCGRKKSHQAKRCFLCVKEEHFERIQNSPIKNYIQAGRGRSRYDSIRQYARVIMQLSNIEKKCFLCSFNVIVHVCHIIPIYTFDENTLMKEVNSIKNLIYLCPNDHALLDAGLIEVGDSRGI